MPRRSIPARRIAPLLQDVSPRPRRVVRSGRFDSAWAPLRPLLCFMRIGRGPARLVLPILTCALVLMGRRSYGQIERAGIVVTRDPGSEDCPSAAELAMSVQRFVPKTIVVVGTDGAEKLVYVEFRRSFEGFQATIHPRAPARWTREIRDVGPRCQSLAEALAVTLAMLLEEDDAPNDSGQTPPKQDPSILSSASSAQRPSPTSVEIGAGAAVGILSAPSLAVTVGLEHSVGVKVAVALGALYAGPNQRDLYYGTTRLDLATSWIRGCIVALGDERALRGRLCLQPMLGVLWGTGKDYSHAGTRSDFWPAVSGGADLQGPLGARFGWWVSASAVVPLMRQGFSVKVGDTVVSVFETPPVGAIVALGMRGIL